MSNRTFLTLCFLCALGVWAAIMSLPRCDLNNIVFALAIAFIIIFNTTMVALFGLIR